MDALDCEFEQLLEEICTFSRLAKDSCADVSHLDSWIEKLQNELTNSEEDKLNRNAYAKYLVLMLIEKNIKWPFNEPPLNGKLPQFFEEIDACEYNQLGSSKTKKQTEHLLSAPFPKYRCQEPEDPQPCPKDISIDVCKKKEKFQKNANDLDECQNFLMIQEIIDNIDDSTVLEEFLLQVAKYTIDNGALLYKVASEESNAFRSFVQSVYDDRQLTIGQALAAEQERLKTQYNLWEKNMLARSQKTLDFIKCRIPEFNYNSYLKDKNYLLNILGKDGLQDPEVAKGDADEQKRLREKYNQMAVHKLNWLNEQTMRIEADNKERLANINCLMDQLTDVANIFACTNNRITMHNKDLECKISTLKQKSDDLQKIIKNLLIAIGPKQQKFC